MRSLLAALCLALVAIPLAATAADKSDLDALQGDWRKTQFQLNGTDGDADKQPSLRIRDDQVFTLQEGKENKDYVLKLKLDQTTNPKLLDVILPNGGTLEGIYKLEEGRWTICLNSDPGIKNRPTTFESPEGSKLIFAVFEKAQ
jgi:uncharacterized protein (TIGR03067 family)